MGRIVFLTNLERQKVMMERARENLLQENRLKHEGRTVLLTDAVLWGDEWEKTFAASDIVFFTYMGSGQISGTAHYLTAGPFPIGQAAQLIIYFRSAIQTDADAHLCLAQIGHPLPA